MQFADAESDMRSFANPVLAWARLPVLFYEICRGGGGGGGGGGTKPGPKRAADIEPG